MANRDVLIRYRYLQKEIEAINRTIDRIGTIGGPKPVHAVQITGMPRGTNNPEAAILQRADYEDMIDMLDGMKAELYGLMMFAEQVVKSITDDRERIIVREYYFNCMTDEEIGELSFNPQLSQTTVNDIRNKALDKIDKKVIISGKIPLHR